MHNACILGISLNMYISGMLQIDYLREQLCCMYVIPYYPSLKLSNTKWKTIMLCCNFFFSSKIIFSFLLGIGSYVNHFRNPVKFLSFFVFCVGDLGDSCLQFVEWSLFPANYFLLYALWYSTIYELSFSTSHFQEHRCYEWCLALCFLNRNIFSNIY